MLVILLLLFGLFGLHKSPGVVIYEGQIEYKVVISKLVSSEIH